LQAKVLPGVPIQQVQPLHQMIDQYKIRDKQLLALDRELNDLHERYWTIVTLKEPVQRGWIRFYTIAEKIGAHKDRGMLSDILTVIGTRSWSRLPDFRCWRRRRKKRVFVEVEQPLKVISASRWEQRKYPEMWKRYFSLQPMRHKRLWHPTYVFAHRGLFELRVEPLLVTEVRVPDPAVLTRISEIERWLRQRNLKPRLDWLRGVRKHWWIQDSRPRKLELLHLCEIRNALIDFPEVDPVPAKRRHCISLRATIFFLA
jgi:hypothetical protein